MQQRLLPLLSTYLGHVSVAATHFAESGTGSKPGAVRNGAVRHLGAWSRNG